MAGAGAAKVAARAGTTHSITGAGFSCETAGAGATYSITGTRQTLRTFQSRGSKALQIVRLGPRDRTVEQSGEWHTEQSS